MINEMEILDDVEILYNKKIIVYGASLSGIRVRDMLMEIGLDIEGFADSDYKKCSFLFENKKVYSLIELTGLSPKEYIIIVASMYLDEILLTIEKEKVDLSVYSWKMVELSMKINRTNRKIPELYKKKIDYIYQLDEYAENRKKILKENLKICLMSTGQNFVYIYQMGKVASTTLYKSLRNYNISAFSMHRIEKNTEILKTFRKLMENKKIRIISGIREPISRMLAIFFQNIEHNLNVKRQKKVYDVISEYLEASYRCEKEGLELGKSGAFLWFENELKQNFGIDVFDYEFNRDAGYTIIYYKNIELLLLKTEKINQLKTVIGEFIGIKDFNLTNSNVGSEKFYKYLYEDVKKNIKIPKYIFDFYYKNNKKMDHFYTEKEKFQFYKKWQNNIDFSEY